MISTTLIKINDLNVDLSIVTTSHNLTFINFLAQHLYNFLGTKAEEITLIDYNRSFFEEPTKLSEWASQCDVIVHIAAMNRHEDQQVIYNTNVGLVDKLIAACEAAGATPKIIFSSSTQEERDNLYGKSKRDGRAALEAWAEKAGSAVCSMVIPNVFGPFGLPFYNSFIATFCHQLINSQIGGSRELCHIRSVDTRFFKG